MDGLLGRQMTSVSDGQTVEKEICPLFIAVLVCRAQRWPVGVN